MSGLAALQMTLRLSSAFLLLRLAILCHEIIMELHQALCHLICVLLWHQDGCPEVVCSLLLQM